MTKLERLRAVTWRHRMLQRAAAAPRGVAQTCRYFGISRKTFYKWKGRFDASGAAGLCDQPRTPKRSPNATPSEVVSKILYLREHYHFGAGRIADYLKRFHQVAIARSSVHRILGKHGMQRLPANQKHRPHKQRWQRYESRSLVITCKSTSSSSSASPARGSACTSSPRSMTVRGFAC